MARNVVKCERFVRAMQKRELSAAFVSWEAEWRRLKSQRRALNRALIRLDAARGVLGVQRVGVDDGSAPAAARAREARGGEDRAQRAGVFVLRLAAEVAREGGVGEAKVALSRTIPGCDKIADAEQRSSPGWRDTHRKLRTDEVKVARCIQRMTQNVVARAFIDWAEKVEAKRKADEQRSRSRQVGEAKLQRTERFHLGVEESVAERRVRAVVGKHAGADGGAQGRAAGTVKPPTSRRMPTPAFKGGRRSYGECAAAASSFADAWRGCLASGARRVSSSGAAASPTTSSRRG